MHLYSENAWKTSKHRKNISHTPLLLVAYFLQCSFHSKTIIIHLYPRAYLVNKWPNKIIKLVQNAVNNFHQQVTFLRETENIFAHSVKISNYCSTSLFGTLILLYESVYCKFATVFPFLVNTVHVIYSKGHHTV